ncbi:MAG: hypothetical protein JST73_10600 [Actinobacteria bacterium]|nr:hypothetical protein [Actinomycetota bacterium]
MTRRIHLAIAAGGIIVAALCAGGTPANAAPATTAAPTIRLVSLDPWVAPVGLVAVALRVSGAPPGSIIVPTLHGAVATRSAFKLTTDGRNLGGVVGRLGDQPVDAGSGPLSVNFGVTDGSTPTAANTVLLRRPGVYPLELELRDPGGSRLTSSVVYIVRLPAASTAPGNDGSHALSVATELRLQPPATTSATGEPTTTALARRSAHELSTGLADVSGGVRASLGFAISPALVDAEALADSSTSPRPTAPTTFRRLASLTEGLPIQAQPWSTVDPATWLATPDLVPFLAANSDHGDTTLTTRLHAPTRTIVDLPAWGGSVSAATLDWFVARGATRFLVPAEALEPLNTSLFPRTLAAPFQIDLGGDRSVTAMQIDPDLEHHFDSPDPVAGANHLIADLSVIALDLPSIERGVVVAPPPGHPASAAFLSAYVRALDTAHPAGTDALVTPTALSAVFANTPPARRGGDTATRGPVLERSLRATARPAPETLLGRQVRTTTADIDSFVTMATGGAPRARAAAQGMRQRVAVAAMPSTTEDRRLAEFTSIRHVVAEAASGIRLPSRQTITLTADSATLPIMVHRTDDGPTELVAHIDAPARLRFLDGKTQPLHLNEPTTRFDLRVHSDSPGDTTIRLTFTSPDGRLVAGDTELVVRSTKASGVGLMISFGSLAFLIVWWIRDIVRARRRRRGRHIPPAELIDIG